jgi:predicted phage terminase large subunit-like protein
LRPSLISFEPKPPGRLRIYHVYFVGIKTTPPFRLSRKLAHCKEKRIKTARYLRAIERTESVTVNCITVDSEDHLYLAGLSMVPTHNSEDDGIVVKRKGNPKESTVEAWGVVEAQPVSKHFGLMIYDDVVQPESVSGPDMIEKTTQRWAESRALTASGGATRYIGTRWHQNDTYREILARGAAIERRHAATADGTETGDPVLMGVEELRNKRRDQGPYVFAAQMLLDPAGDKQQGFREEWLRYHDEVRDGAGLNKYILVDSANEKKRQSDYTAMVVIGLGADQNYYLLDIVRDRLSLPERADALFELHRRWRPMGVGVEQYGMMADASHFEDRQRRENYRFEITKVGGSMPKPDRIKRLVPVFEQGRFYLPETMGKVDYQGKWFDLVQSFLNDEYRAFPVPVHDDMLDACSRIFDMNVTWPKAYVELDRYAQRRRERTRGISWQAA